jgi:plastocyanin
MAPLHKSLIPVTLLAAAIACGGSDQNKSAPPASPAAAPAGAKVDAATAGSITGKVVFEGTPPPAQTISMASDPACASANKDPKTETYIVDDGGLENVFVYVKSGLDPKYVFDTPTDPVKLDQQGCHYVPHVLGVRVGQPLAITNSDNTMHNVHGLPETNQEFNYSQPVPMTSTVTFTAPEVLIPFKCDVHSWMNAHIGVVSNPYFAVTADGGKFELRSLPPGTYTIEAVHEKLGRQSQSVTVPEKGTQEITFTFKAAASGN